MANSNWCRDAKTPPENDFSLLSFYRLRVANVARCNADFHNLEEWSPSDWAVAMAGECGEACNIIKKMRRAAGSMWHRESETNTDAMRALLAAELADLVTYADLLAARMGIDLGGAVAQKFNEVSLRINSPIRL